MTGTKEKEKGWKKDKRNQDIVRDSETELREINPGQKPSCPNRQFYWVSACKLEPVCIHFFLGQRCFDITESSLVFRLQSMCAHTYMYTFTRWFEIFPWTDDVKETLRNKQLISWHMVSLLLLFLSRSLPLPLLPQDATNTHTHTHTHTHTQ